MSLESGARLGPYEVLAPLGAGGMGEVYRARDTKLGRDVAIKILSEAFALDPERIARFEREAQLLAALNHPHIAAIYGLEEAAGTRFLILELVEGPTLADRLKPSALSHQPSGGLPVAEALSMARQIVDALEAAHEKGITHRDLKPANIALTADGLIKVLDFGLAKFAEAGGAGRAGQTGADVAQGQGPAGLSQLPTLMSPMVTGAGVILGTAAYMAPEQVKGRSADKRCDIWAFGCVLFEMLTGQRAFEGEDVSDTLAAILRGEPDWRALPGDVPPHIRTLLRRCVEKDRKARIADISTVRYVMDEASAANVANVVNPADVAKPADLANPVNRFLPWAVASALAISLAGFVGWSAPWQRVAPHAPVRLTAELGADASLWSANSGAAAVLSPDGSLLAFVAQKSGGKPQLFVRRLEQLQATPLSGTDEATSPFFSPDGQWIAFFAEQKLKKISVTGGAAVTLADVPLGKGGTWSEDGTIVFSPANTAGVSLLRVSAAGGKTETFTSLDQGEVTQRFPQLLPGGKAILFMGHSGTGNYEDANLVVQPLPAGPRRVVVRGGYYGRYLSSGHLTYIHEGTLFAVPFDLGRLETTGQAVPAIEGVSSGPGGGAQVAVSTNGTLVYLHGGTLSNGLPVHWLNRDGKTTTLRATPANWSNIVFAPDGRRLAMDINDGRNTDVWTYEWERDTLSRLTFDPTTDLKPVWTPDGGRIAFASNRHRSSPNLYWQRADGTGEVQRLTTSSNAQFPGSWHPSGKFLAFQEITQAANDLMILPMEGNEATGWKPGKPTVFLNTPFSEYEPAFSPDGRWIAYTSNETGQNEVYVRPFPGPGGKWPISTGGGITPTWSRARHELFYATREQRIVVVPYTVESDSFHADKPRPWTTASSAPASFRTRPRTAQIQPRAFDLHPDGDRFALAATSEAEAEGKQDKVVFIFNFFDELRRIAPPAKR